MTRICITLPQELIQEFDYVLKKNGCTSRRKGLQYAMEKYINENKWATASWFQRFYSVDSAIILLDTPQPYHILHHLSHFLDAWICVWMYELMGGYVDGLLIIFHITLNL